jgi:omega-hydroxy-beta-dihydromenaquinone-9 sulfotransferase
VSQPSKPARDDEWSAHIWSGCDLFAWLRLITAGRFAFGWKQLHLLPLATMFGLGHTFLRFAQNGLYRDRLRDVRLAPPVFILGHWRTGTTLLHELLIQDPRHTSPNTYQCFDPCHPLLTEWIAHRFLNWMLPSKRMMDNMPVGWGRPQEEEFALALLGAPSPYATVAFPNHGPPARETFDLDGLPPKDRERWKRTFLWFLRMLAVRDDRRFVLKSPPHTCRIPTLLELFPDARFVYLVRNPFDVYASTVNLWKILYRKQALHTPTYAGLEDFVFDTFLHFHHRVEATKGLVPAGRFHELRFEELAADPEREVRGIYERLDLGDYEPARPPIDKYLSEAKSYQRNKWSLGEAERKRIEERWGEVIRHYGYTAPPTAATPPGSPAA